MISVLNIFFYFFLALSFFLYSCNSDSPETLPIVTTSEVTNVTTTSATAGGVIESDGNSVVTEAGLVYSEVLGMPTLADEKIVGTVTTGAFSCSLENLSSGKVYHVRAFATNSQGTAYGDAVEFVTGNMAPSATNLSVQGGTLVGNQLSAVYTYADAEDDPEGATTLKWYTATSSTGTDETVIEGETGLGYTVKNEDFGKYIRFGVVPVALSGNLFGAEIKSSFIGAIGDDNTVTFTYNGAQVTYGIINSPVTGRKWLDRNLGAAHAATSVADYASYGDLFQWGRPADGHQVVTRKGPGDADVAGKNGMTTVHPPFQTSSTDNPGHAMFIIVQSQAGDWRDPQNGNLWQGVDGVNNPCPKDWRIPTEQEWMDENLVDLSTAFANLKITYTGTRWVDSGEFAQSTTTGTYWSSTLATDNLLRTMRARFSPSFGSFNSARGDASACRCIEK